MNDFEMDMLLKYPSIMAEDDCVTSVILEGEKGAGKTHKAREIAEAFVDTPGVTTKLLKKQMYPNIDKGILLYDVNLQNVIEKSTSTEFQELAIEIELTKMQEISKEKLELLKAKLEIVKTKKANQPIYSLGILPKAIEMSNKQKIVVLIDEIDKTSPDIENYFYDILQSWDFSDPVLGDFKGNKRNVLIIFTSNQDRELSEPFRRRCKTIHMEYPDFEKMLEILNNLAPQAIAKLAKTTIGKVIKFHYDYRGMEVQYRCVANEVARCLNELVLCNYESRNNKLEVMANILQNLSPYSEDRVLIKKCIERWD